MSIEVDIPRQFVMKSVRMCLIVVSVIGFILLGRSVSPIGNSGFPLLLSPRLLAVTTYYQETQLWIDEIREIQEQLSLLLTDTTSTLLAKDVQINYLIGEVQSLELDMDGTNVPSSLETTQNNILECLSQTQASIETTSSWILDPSESNLSAARQSLDHAEDMLEQLNLTSWVQTQP